jgi:pectate lyase
MIRFIISFAALLCSGLTLSASSARDYLSKSIDWFAGDEAALITTNILSWQSPHGGWPKNTSTAGNPYTGDIHNLRPTFDNGATLDELRFLAHRYRACGDSAAEAAFLRGLTYVLDAQYKNGGWPQFSPPGRGYHRFITFNDNAMVRIMHFVREVAEIETYDFISSAFRNQCENSFERGIECILQCQIRVDGKLTVWCAQHDEVDFRPQSARSYELASFSGAESVGITRLLMSLEEPSEEVIQAVEGAIRWFQSSRIEGIRIDRMPDEDAPRGFNKVIVTDKNASPLWARFYDIKSRRPIFCDRDGIPKSTLAEIGYERRNGYAWYGSWPRRLLEVEYPAWRMRLESQ